MFKTTLLNYSYSSSSQFQQIQQILAKSLARRPGAIVFTSQATNRYHCPARRATLI